MTLGYLLCNIFRVMRARCLDYVSIYIPKKIYSLYTTVHEYVMSNDERSRQN